MTAPSAKKARPLSPHLLIYKPQLTSSLSIFHRATGVALAVGLPVFVLWLVALASGPEDYGRFLSMTHCWLAKLALFGWTFAFFFHFCMGIRHLCWDIGLFLDIKQAYTTGYIALSCAVLMTLFVWITYYGLQP